MSLIKTIVIPMPVELDSLIKILPNNNIVEFNITKLLEGAIVLGESIYYGVDTDEINNRVIKLVKELTLPNYDEVIQAAMVNTILKAATLLLSIIAENNCIVNHKVVRNFTIFDSLIYIDVYDYP